MVLHWLIVSPRQSHPPSSIHTFSIDHPVNNSQEEGPCRFSAVWFSLWWAGSRSLFQKIRDNRRGPKLCLYTFVLNKLNYEALQSMLSLLEFQIYHSALPNFWFAWMLPLLMCKTNIRWLKDLLISTSKIKYMAKIKWFFPNDLFISREKTNKRQHTLFTIALMITITNLHIYG